MTTISTISEVKTSKIVTIQPMPHQSQDASPTQVIVQIPKKTPTQIPVSALQPVPPPRIPSDTENKAPYPVCNLSNPTESRHPIPIAGKF